MSIASLPRRVRWRDAWHAHAIRWLYSYGPGPFEVVGKVDRSGQGLPAGLLIKSALGEREVSEVWLEEEPPGDDDCGNTAKCFVSRPPLSVLVVDDDCDTADSLSTLVGLWGYRPLKAYAADTAREMACRERPAVVVLDLSMPGENGWEMARRLRAVPALEGVVLLAVSGYGQEAYREKSRAAGIDEHLVKPVEPELLCRLLEHYAARQRQRLGMC